jgi:hypothetical protein
LKKDDQPYLKILSNPGLELELLAIGFDRLAKSGDLTKIAR